MKIALVSILTFISVYFIQAQTPVQSSLLWEVSGKGLAKPSYLFGTFHIMCKEDFEITTALKEKFNSTTILFEEMKMDDPSIQMKMLAKMKSDKSLKELLDSNDYKIVADSFQKITGMSISFFNNFKPFASISLLTQKMIDCKNVIQPETEFVKLAKEKQMEVLGLETVDDEIRAIDKMPLDSQINSLLQTVKNFDSAKQMMIQMVAVYKKRNPDELYKFMKSGGLNDVFETAMLEERNKNWLPVIIKNLKKQPTFFAFGAGHLSGNYGIINLLRKKGYKVTPISY
ncbi:MAG: TraB/GumN family protein [Chitinophagaceae bacterium]